MANERMEERDQEYCRALCEKHGVGYGIPGAGTFRAEPHAMSALLEAVQAMRERAAQSCEAGWNYCPSTHSHHLNDATMIRALTLTAKDVKS